MAYFPTDNRIIKTGVQAKGKTLNKHIALSLLTATTLLAVSGMNAKAEDEKTHMNNPYELSKRAIYCHSLDISAALEDTQNQKIWKKIRDVGYWWSIMYGKSIADLNTISQGAKLGEGDNAESQKKCSEDLKKILEKLPEIEEHIFLKQWQLRRGFNIKTLPTPAPTDNRSATVREAAWCTAVMEQGLKIIDDHPEFYRADSGTEESKQAMEKNKAEFIKLQNFWQARLDETMQDYEGMKDPKGYFTTHYDNVLKALNRTETREENNMVVKTYMLQQEPIYCGIKANMIENPPASETQTPETTDQNATAE